MMDWFRLRDSVFQGIHPFLIMASNRRSLISYLRMFLTLLTASAILFGIWKRLSPKLHPLPASATQPKPFDPAFNRLSPQEIASLPLAIRFDHPLGSEHGALTYNAQPFRISRHLGDDLNGIGGQNSDLGDPVYAAADGRVVFAADGGEGWGHMIILAHRVVDPNQPGQMSVWQTVYAHLEEKRARCGEVVRRGDEIGSVGTANGRYWAHLHFEIREGPHVNPGVGYADEPLNRVSPERFLFERRGAPPDQLNPAPRPDPVEVEVTRLPTFPQGE